jgi:aryl-alcohol dehydrogenase-like predicted oxidoreductase
VTPAALSIAWVLAVGKDNIVPLIGARTREQLKDIPVAMKLELSPEDLARIDREVADNSLAGTRYAEAQMAHLDSER